MENHNNENDATYNRITRKSYLDKRKCITGSTTSSFLCSSITQVSHMMENDPEINMEYMDPKERRKIKKLILDKKKSILSSTTSCVHTSSSSNVRNMTEYGGNITSDKAPAYQHTGLQSPSIVYGRCPLSDISNGEGQINHGINVENIHTGIKVKMASTLLLAVVFVFDLVAFALAVAAEQRRASARIAQDTNSRYCVYESDIATWLGVGAFLFLFVTQLFVMVATRCMCCGRALSPGRSRALAVFLFITCWVTFIIAEACLLAGSVRNAYHTKYRSVLSANPPSCETLRKGVFGAGAAFVVFTGIVSELYYVFYSKSDEGVIPTRDTGIRMGAF